VRSRESFYPRKNISFIRQRVTASICLCILAIATQSLNAQQEQPNSYGGFEGQAVSSVVIAAGPDVDLDAIRRMIRQQAGQPLSTDAIRESVAALQQTERFAQVQVSLEPEQSGLRLLFILQPADYIGAIDFPGTGTRFPYTGLLQAVNIPEQSAYFPELLTEGRKRLSNYLRKSGYFEADVQPEVQRDEAHRVVNLRFRCTLKKQAKVRNITFNGISDQQSANLRAELKSTWARLKLVSLKPGQKYSQQRIDKSIAFMSNRMRTSTQLAPNIRLTASNFDATVNQVDVVFDVTPGPKVSVRVAGVHMSKRAMRKLIPIYEENSVDQDLVDEGQRNLRSYFQAKGYFDATVDSHVDNENGVVNVVYEVGRGGKHEVKGVYLDGNAAFSDKQLRPYLAVKKGLFFLHGSYSEQLLKKSTDALTQFYKDHGFQNVAVRPKVEDFDPEVDVTFEITEGPQDRVASLQVEGNKTQSLAALQKKNKLQLQPGKPYSAKLQELDRSTLLAAYLDLGYLNASIRSSATPQADDPQKINVTYTIDEGPQANISNVVLLGEKHTRPKLIDKITQSSFKPGQPMSEGHFLQAQSDLYSLGVFDWASVKALRPIVDQTQEEVLIKVHESALNSMDIGGGIEIIPRDGNVPVNSVVVPGIPPISLGNKFTVSQKSYFGPRFTFDYTRHDLFGDAESATIGTVLSRLDQRGFFNYSIPHLHGSSWSSLLSVNGERTTENPIYTAEQGLASAQVEKALNKNHTKNVIVRYSFQRIDLYNILIPELVLPQDQHVRLSTFEGEYIRDTRDKPLDAHRGMYQTFDFGITSKKLGASDDFLRFLGQTAFYKPVKPWLVWANNFRLGLAKPFSGSEVPLSERFFTGGADSLRGFPINGAGPQRPVPVCSNPSNPATCTLISVPVGGNMLFIFNSELRFPLPVYHSLGGVIFYDGGNVYSAINLRQFADGFTHSVGIGLRYQTPVGPVRFDIGYRITSVPGVQSAQYFVTLGQSF
jgi:outer membrane protein insertion porin family